MLCIELRFPAGRYHATPWGRHVNEGVPEWPPAPHRLARALYDIWKRRFPSWDEPRVAPLFAALSGSPLYWLPGTGASHLRLFQRQGSDNATDRQKVFDAFVTIDRDEPVLLAWPDADLSENQRDDLDTLLRSLDWLGRSESWVEARLVAAPPDRAPEAVPCTGDAQGDPILIACLRPPSAWDDLPVRPVRLVEEKVGGRKNRREVPWTWLEALSFSSSDLVAEGWSAPPLLLPTAYDVRSAVPARATTGDGAGLRVTHARFLLDGPVLPRVIHTVAVAEQVRVRLMGSHRRLQGGDASRVSPRFSGKNPDGHPLQGHRHCTYLPLDEDGDGFLDHLLLTCAEPLSPSEVRALDGLRKLWQSDGRPDVDVVLTGMGTARDLATASTTWRSATPFVPGRHHRHRDGDETTWLAREVARECGYHGLPAPIGVEPMDAETPGLRDPWWTFQRCRKGEVPRRGHGLRLVFAEEVWGPFTLGYGSHFGLGAFVRDR